MAPSSSWSDIPLELAGLVLWHIADGAQEDIRRGEDRTLVAGTFIPSGWEFEVFMADFQQSKWTKVTNIGDDQVLFLRRRCSRFNRVSPEEMLGTALSSWIEMMRIMTGTSTGSAPLPLILARSMT
jgi:hypothetical protein